MKNDMIPLISSFSKEGIDFINVKNNVGMDVTFANLGAAIYQIKYEDELMTSQVKDVKDFLSHKIHNGKAVGRVSGKIEGGLFIGDNKYIVHPNDDENGKNKEGIGSKKFASRVFTTTEHVHVVYTYFSKAGSSGYPGNALFEVHYIISNNKPKLKIKMLNYVTETTPISMTVHTFFSLGEKSIKDLKMAIKAKKYLELDPATLSLGEVKEVSPCLDFTRMKAITKDIEDKSINTKKLAGYDHCYLFDKVDEEKSQIQIESKKYKVDIYTDLDAVVVYSDNTKDGIARDNSNEPYRRGISIEPQRNPKDNILINRKDEFSYFIRYEFSKK